MSNTAEIAEVCRRHLVGYELAEAGTLRVHQTLDGWASIMCQFDELPQWAQSRSYFAVNIGTNGLFYLLGIGLARKYRGRGLGSQLYTILEEIAAELGCLAVVMTPSGITLKGETRFDYMLRKGYKPYGPHEVIKELSHEPDKKGR